MKNEGLSELVLSPFCPTGHFTILEPQIQEIGEFHRVQLRRVMDSKAPKLWKGQSGEHFANSALQNLSTRRFDLEQRQIFSINTGVMFGRALRFNYIYKV